MNTLTNLRALHHCCWALCLGLLPLAGVAQEAVGTLKSLKGQAQLEREGMRRPARAGEALQARDGLLTGSDGHASVGLRDESALAIGPNSDVALSRYRFDPVTHQGEQQVALKSGSLAAISGKLVKASPQAVQFNAGTMTLGVRGTQFVVEVQPEASGQALGPWGDGSGRPLRSSEGLCWTSPYTEAERHSACRPHRVVLMPDREGQVGQVHLSAAGRSLALQSAYAGALVGPQELQAQAQDAAEVAQRYQGLLATLPPAPQRFVLRFASGSAQQLDAPSQQVLAQVRAAMAQWPVAVDVSVVGHTDSVGSLASNDALSLERARSVARLLRDAGVPPERVQASGRGKRELRVATPDETPEPQNRRVEVTLY